MKKYSKYHLPTLLFMLAAGFMSVSCADEDIAKDQKYDGKNGVSFSVTDVQDALDADIPTRATDAKTYLTHSIDFNEAGTSDICLQESTIPGVNPMKRTPQTRAWLKSTIDANFGAFACKNGSAGPDYFYNEQVNPSGQMLQPKSWGSTASTLKFYAVYPYMDGTNTRQKLVQATSGSLPYVEFEASTDIANQTNLMTAETAPINYTSTGGSPHVVPLKFYHALTAIRFGIGSNLSWNKTIKSIEFQGIYKAGHFDLATKAWSHQNGTQNFKLDNVNQSTSGTQNTVIVKDGNTFLMVPQTLPAGAKIVITFTDNSHITANIGGKIWAPGTTKTYMMTERNSNWDYKIEVTSPAAIPYNQSQSGAYTIRSYRQDKISNYPRQGVRWKVIGYDANNDDVFDMNEKPTWLTSLNKTEGNGGYSAESGTATVSTEELVDLLAPRQAALKLNPKGSSSDYYDLSLHDIHGVSRPRSTANSYVISHPGFYKIPLVYGNAITGGNTNEHSYKTDKTDAYILRNFVDHMGQPINDPWIEKTNGGANNGVNGAKLIWSDEQNLVHNLAITHDASGDGYLQFEVKADDIKCGNAVVAAFKKVGTKETVVWSWHLWFTGEDVLDPIETINNTNHKYYVSTEAVGCKFNKWMSTTYKQPRQVKVRVIQLDGPQKTAEFTITQNPGSEHQGTTTLYQFGRKDAFPGTNTYYGSLVFQAATQPGGNGGTALHAAIQNPHAMFNYRAPYHQEDWCNTTYTNLWSMDNNTFASNDNTSVKTIYDPSPVGYKLPPAPFFSGLSVNSWETDGANLNNKAVPDAIIFFIVGGMRDFASNFALTTYFGRYWSANPVNPGNSVTLDVMSYRQSFGIINAGHRRVNAWSVHPVAE